ncbi:hypothetical protein NBRC116601_00580 [Cognatishimia sp. WU-CL00825]
MSVRAKACVFDQNLPDQLIVVGGDKVNTEAWSPRVREMQRTKKPVAFFSDAATAYIRSSSASEQRLTTHWQDVKLLCELGYYPELTTKYVEQSRGILTSAGGNYTTELTLGMIAAYLSAKELANLSALLIVKTVRDGRGEQPKGPGYLTNAFSPSICRAIRCMEENISPPFSVLEIAEVVGMSVRQLERQFAEAFNTSPGRFYRRVRVERAHLLVTESEMKLIDVAVAAGFSSISSLTSAFVAEYGMPPKKLRGVQAISLDLSAEKTIEQQ